MRTGALQDMPPSVLRANMTSIGSSLALGTTEHSKYTFPRVGPSELSTATHACPSRPSGFGLPETQIPMPPPRLTVLAKSHCTGRVSSCMVLDLTTTKPSPVMYSSPSGPTAIVPQYGLPGVSMGAR